MKIKIIDFIMAIGEICNEHGSCIECPLNVNIHGFHECTIDTTRMRKQEIAQYVKDETIKYMLRKESESKDD